jgi:ribosomal protein S18 acetylase RimI-like enzyme
MKIRPFTREDAPAVAALSERYFPPDPTWSADVAWTQLTSDALGGGAHARVAERGGAVVGVVAFVRAAPWLYIWPLAADDEEAAGALLDAAVAAGRGPGIERARVSTRSGEPHKRAAIVARGLERSIDFLDMRRAPAPIDAPVGRTAEPRRGAAIDRATTHELHDRTFSEIANTSPMTDADFAALLDGPRAWPSATSAWHDADGRCVGFVIGLRHDDHGVVEAIGVDPAWRGKGLARAMLADLLAIATAEGVPEVRAIIASTNPASLALHERAGFVEHARKELWDLPL